MRISTSMIYDQLTDSVSRNMEDLKQTQAQMSAGKKYTRPSEAADVVGRVQSVESRIKTLEADFEAVVRTKVGVTAQSNALEVAAGVMDRLKEISFQASNDPLSAPILASLSAEVTSLKRSLIDIANTRDSNDRYIFAGLRSNEIPYVVKADGSVTYEGSTTPLRIRVGDVSYEDASVAGPSVWKSVPRGASSVSFFTALTEFEKALKDNTLAGRRQALSDVEAMSNTIAVAVARSGGVEERLKLAEEQAQETAARAKVVLSEFKDLDYAEAVATLERRELLVQASQSLIGRLSRLSLLEYIR